MRITAEAAMGTGFWDCDTDLFRRMIQTILADKAAFADVPRGASVILVPHDADDAFLEASVEVGRNSLRTGLRVYLRHVGADELPPVAEPEIAGEIEDYFVKRERFDTPIEHDEYPDEDQTR
jgi:hypothetical protein